MGEINNICFYHNDMDGIASASIVLVNYPDTEFVPVQYGNDVSEYLQGKDFDNVFVVDFSFSEDYINKNIFPALYNKRGTLIWIDHHESAKKKLPRLWNSDIIEGKRDTTKSGCELTWEYFYPNKPKPTKIKLIGDRDLWKFNYSKTEAFHEVASLIYTEPTSSLLNEDYIDETLGEGCTLLWKKNKQVEKSYNEGKSINFKGYKTLLVNSNLNHSEIGNYGTEQGYDIVLIWSCKGNKLICSLRSRTVNVREIAESYGGGGHDKAAGFPSNMELIKLLYENAN